MTREFQVSPVFNSANPLEHRLAQLGETNPDFAQKLRADFKTRSAEIRRVYWRTQTARRKGGQTEIDLQALQQLRQKEFQVRRFLVGEETTEDNKEVSQQFFLQRA